jgi:hypothetical protein
MTRAHDDLIDLVQQRRREQAHVIFERLVVVRLFIKRGMPQHFANRVVVIHQFMQPVVVLIQV